MPRAVPVSGHGGARKAGQDANRNLNGSDNPTYLTARIADRTSDRIRAAAGKTDGVALPADGSVHPGNAALFAQHTQSNRAAIAGVGRRTQQKLDRLARDFPALHKGKVNQHTVVAQIGQPQRARAATTGISRNQQQRLDRLARDFPALHKRVTAGALSVNAIATTTVTSGGSPGAASCPGSGRSARHRAPQRVLGAVMPWARSRAGPPRAVCIIFILSGAVTIVRRPASR